jgi:osmotically-inducible protein OsmY
MSLTMKAFVRSITTSVVFALLSMSAQAGPVGKAADPVRDQAQTMKARGVLFMDPALAAYNIGVIVQDRTATLWGPVPSAEVAFRAELCLRGMPELREVRNDLMVHEAIQPIRGPVNLEPAPGNAPRVLPELLPPELPREVRTPMGAPAVLTGMSSAEKPSAPQAKVKPANASHASGSQNLTAEIASLLLSNNRFQPVQFVVEDGRVYLRSTQPQQSDVLQEAARAIARLPNVKGVVIR